MDQSLNHDKCGDSSGHSVNPDPRTIGGVCLLLSAITFAVFGQTLNHDFVNFDDGLFVTSSPDVMSGLTVAGIKRAFTHGSFGFWDPLTTLSHMLDVEMFGLHPTGHHLTNVLLHMTSVCLLFLVLQRMTGKLWRSAFVAAVFAIHPLRVESVAWVSERKDVLSGVFFMLALGAYERYANNPPKLARYLLVLLCFALGLMSKVMLVTLPFVLLLLDFWPLNRFAQPAPAAHETAPAGWWTRLSVPARLLLEKIPLLALSLAAGSVTVLTQNRVHAVISLAVFPFGWRLANALVSPVVYIRQMFYPAGLEVFYPFPSRGVPLWTWVPASAFLASVSALAVFLRRERPYLLVGWLWYLVMLLPVIGLLQAGAQAHADRYTYLPQIGLYMALTWTAAELGADWPNRRRVFGLAAIVVIAALGAVAHVQASYWRNSESLWNHTLACEPDNVLAHYDLGMTMIDSGRNAEGMVEFQRALRIQPDYPDARNNLGYIFFQQGKVDEAMAQYNLVLKSHPDNPLAHYSLGLALAQKGRLDEAIAHLEKALAVLPDDAKIRNNLATAYLEKRRVDDAMAQYRQALTIEPDSVLIRNNFGHLAWILAASPDDSLRNGAKAVGAAQELVRLSGGNEPVFLMILAAAYAETGKFADAIATAERAQKLATEQSNFPLVGTLQAQLYLYQSGRPVRDASLKITNTPP
jgi:Flp pilus assembly protein TadD